VFGSNGITGYHAAALVVEPTIIVGRKGSVGAVHLVREPCFPIDTTYYLHRKKPEQIDLDFLQVALQQLNLNRLKTATGVPGLNREDAYRENIPLPPLDEQRRIVEILNRANGIRRLRRDALDKARQLIPALFVDIFGDPTTNRKGWDEVPFSEIITYSKYGPRFPNRPYSPHGPHILRTTDMLPDGTLRISGSPRLAISDDELRKHALRPRTLLITRSGTIGRLALFRGHTEPCIAGAYLIEFGLHDTVNEDYVLTFLLTEHGQSCLLRGSRSMTLANLNAPTIKKIPIPLPPVFQQRAFAERAADIQATIAQQERTAEGSEQLVASLMAQLFDGAPAKPDTLDQKCSANSWRG
jgi:type I restriction enzyme S subunit